MMTYIETKEFQDLIYRSGVFILNEISNIFLDDSLIECLSLIETEIEFRALSYKLVPKSIAGIEIQSFKIDFDQIHDLDKDEVIKIISIKQVDIRIKFSGEDFGISIKTNKNIKDNINYLFNTRFSILGTISHHSNKIYKDSLYDTRYFPITLSKNPYNILFINDELGVISTIEYNKYYDLDFSSDYNTWDEEQFLIQRLTI